VEHSLAKIYKPTPEKRLFSTEGIDMAALNRQSKSTVIDHRQAIKPTAVVPYQPSQEARKDPRLEERREWERRDAERRKKEKDELARKECERKEQQRRQQQREEESAKRKAAMEKAQREAVIKAISEDSSILMRLYGDLQRK
jgi:murein L,D-transpeptidase YafK